MGDVRPFEGVKFSANKSEGLPMITVVFLISPRRGTPPGTVNPGWSTTTLIPPSFILILTYYMIESTA
jgi:hypothetical protein